MSKEEKKVNEEEIVQEEMTDIQPETEESASADDNVAELEQKFKDMQDSYLRLNAEFDNYRKRTLKEKADLLKTANEKVFIDVVSLVDDFDRALENIGSAEDVEAIKEGVDLIYSKFVSFLTKSGVKEIDTIGEVFDLDKHEAITTIPAQSEEDKDKVVDCIQKGYTLGDKVIRYPKVIVAK